jgi:trans-2,3-dihydro-3-hydroxyanthranilate isomerase
VRTLRYNLCDVFTDRPLTGNPLAVFTDARTLDAATMQALAREMNLSETAFVLPPTQGGRARLRIFTPTQEIPFAGHPTLGAAVVLGGPMKLDQLAIETGAGIVPVRFEREGARISFAWMLQPVPKVAPFAHAEALFGALGVQGSGLPVEVYDNGVRHVYVELPSREAVAALRPDLGRLAALPALGFNAFAGAGTSWKTRMFAPGGGVPEDPATGSAAGPLALHLARHGRIRFGDEITIEQGAEIQRPSELVARVTGSAEAVEMVEVGGRAIVVARGEFNLP